MVKQTKIIFNVADIANIRLRCRKCSSGSIRSFKEGQSAVPDRCPSCFAEWIEPHTEHRGLHGASLLFYALKQTYDGEVDEKAPMVVELEFDDASSEASSAALR